MYYVDKIGREQKQIHIPHPEVLRAGVAHAEADLEHWNQKNWMTMGDRLPDGQGGCGTTACLAGHIMLSQGKTWEQLYKERWFISEEAAGALGLYGADHLDFQDEIFYLMWADENADEYLAETQENLDRLKQRITEVTGVTFDE